MMRLKIYKLSMESRDKEFYLLNKLLDEQMGSDSILENIKNSRNIVYVANSRDKINRIVDYLNTQKNGFFRPRFVTIEPLFAFLYDTFSPERRLKKHLLSDAYARIIIRHILIGKGKELFPSSDFSLSAETSDFFLDWFKKIKEYNLRLKYRGVEIIYRKDAPIFDLTNKENRFNEGLFSTLGKIFHLYQTFLEDNNLVDESDKRWWIIDHLEPKILKEYNFYIEHLSILRTIEQQLFKEIYREAKTVSLLDFAFSFPGAQFTTTGIIGGDKEVIELKPRMENPSQVIKLHSYNGKEQEVEAIAKKVDEERMSKKIVIVSPEIDKYEKIFERIFPLYSIEPPSLSQMKLSENPIVKTCLAIFEIINQRLKRKSVVSFLLSPHIKLLKQKEKRILDTKTREELIVSGDDWQRLKDQGAEMRKVINFTRELMLLASKKGLAFIHSYLALLNSLLDIEDENDLKAYNKFFEFIVSFQREPLLGTIEAFGMKDFQKILFSYSESVKIRTSKVVNEDIEMLNIEEIGGMNFDRVFLIGLVEGKLPKVPMHNPLFSEKLLEEMGFPTYDMLYALSKFNFESLLKSGEEVYCSYYKKDKQGNLFLQSPFIKGIEKEETISKEDSIDTLLEWEMGIGEIIHRGEDFNEAFFTQDMKKRALLIRDGIERSSDEHRLKNVKDILLSNKGFLQYIEDKIKKLSRSISPFALETYKRCPYNFFLGYLLRLGRMEEPEEGLDNLIRGKVIHKVLADFYKRKIGTRIGKDFINNWDEIREITLHTIEEMVPGSRDRILLRLELISNDYSPLMKKFLKNEVEKNINHTIMDVEWEFSGKDVNIIKDGEQLCFMGRIDRIDKIDDGLVIIDYKTGNKRNLASNKNIEEGNSLQFPIYNYAVEKSLGKVSETTYYVINSGDGVFMEEREKIQMDVFILNIFRIWEEIKELNFEPKPRSGCITHCPFNQICPEAI